MTTISERMDNATAIPPRYMQAFLPPPKRVKIEISPRWHYRCGFCAFSMREAQPKWDMDFRLFKRIARQMRDAGVEEIGVFYLGESFVNPRLLVECIAYLKDKLDTPYVFFSSNAAMAFPEAVDECMKAGLDSLRWSVNAADAQQFAKHLGVSGTLFYNALYNIKAAWKTRKVNRCKTALFACSPRSDGEQQTKMEALLAEHVRPYVDAHSWLPQSALGAFATRREEERGYRPTALSEARMGIAKEALPCSSAFTEAHVTADGKLSACCFDADPKWAMGDLTWQPFMEAWNSLPFVKFREAHLNKDVRDTQCERCIAHA